MASDRPGRRSGCDPGSDRFRSWIDQHGLLEMGPSDVVYKWHGGRSRSHMDRFFMSIELATLYPAATWSSRERPLSDHTPLLWDDGSSHSHRYSFRVLHSWLKEPWFRDMVQGS